MKKRIMRTAAALAAVCLWTTGSLCVLAEEPPGTEDPAGTEEPADPEVDAEEVIRSANAEDEGLAQLDELEEDRQNAVTAEYDEQEDQAYVSSFILSRIRTGTGEFDASSDMNGNDSTDENDLVRTNDQLTYVFSYSCALRESAQYNTLRNARIYVRYELDCTPDEAVFDPEAMPWLHTDETSAVRTENGVQILEGYRILPETVLEDRTFSVPSVGLLNCVIQIRDMPSGSVITPRFYASLRREEETGNMTGASGTDPSVTVTCGTFAYAKITRINTDSAYAAYTHSYQTNGTYQTVSGRLKPFRYEIVVGKQNGSVKGVMPLDPSAPVRLIYRKDYQAFDKNGNAVTNTAAVYDIKTLGSDTSGINGHTVNESNMLKQYWKENSLVYGTVSDIRTDNTSSRRESFGITGITKTRPGDTASIGTVILVQQQKQTSDGDRYICSLTCFGINVKGLYGNAKTISQNVKDTFEQMTVAPGLWNTSVHLYSVNQNLKNSEYLSGSVGSTSNVIPYRNRFKATANHTNIPTEDSGKEKAFNTWLLWDNRLVEPDLIDGIPYIRQTYFASYTQTGFEENYNVRYITKKDRTNPYFASETEMKNCNMMTFDSLCFWNTYEAAMNYAGTIVGVLVEARNVNVQQLYADNIHTVEVLLRPTADALSFNTPARITTGTWSWTQSFSSSMASATGKGTLPPAANTLQKADRNAIYTCTRWNGNTIVSSSLNSTNKVFYGATLRIDGFVSRVRTLTDSGQESAVMDLSAAQEAVFRVVPLLESVNPASAPEVWLKIYCPAQNGTAAASLGTAEAVFPDGTGEMLEDGESVALSGRIAGQTGTMDIAVGNGEILIMFTDVRTDAALPEIRMRYPLDAHTLDPDALLTLTAEIDGDARAVTKKNGKISEASIRFYDLSSWKIYETVDKAKAYASDTLTYTVNVQNRSRSPEYVSVIWDLPCSGTDGTVLNDEAQLHTESAVIMDGVQSTEAPVTAEGRVEAEMQIPAGGSRKIIITVRAEGLDEQDVIHAKAQMYVQDMSVDSNMVETKALGRIILPDTGSYDSTVQRMITVILFFCTVFSFMYERRRKQ